MSSGKITLAIYFLLAFTFRTERPLVLSPLILVFCFIYLMLLSARRTWKRPVFVIFLLKNTVLVIGPYGRTFSHRQPRRPRFRFKYILLYLRARPGREQPSLLSPSAQKKKELAHRTGV